jgi:hypothetical protein
MAKSRFWRVTHGADLVPVWVCLGSVVSIEL